MDEALTTRIAPSRGSSGTRLPSIDGWRAISILLVLGTHCPWAEGFPRSWEPIFKWLFDGNLGVRFFFIISGFLITYLMIAESEREGSVNLKHFYLRRAFRILPVYFAFLGVLFLLQIFTPFRQSALAWGGCLTFTRDFIDGTQADLQISRHLWSLSVEEQFYLLWPCVFSLMHKMKLKHCLWWAIVFPICFSPIFRVVDHWRSYPAFLNPLFANFSFFKYFDSIAVGCGGALLFARYRDQIKRFLIADSRVIEGVSIALILVPYLLDHLMVARFVTIPFGPTMQAFGFSTLLLKSLIMPHARVYRALNYPFVRTLGVLSYSIYIWQQIFWTRPLEFGLESVWWMSFPGMLVSSIGVAAFSYVCLERPFIKWRACFR
ncbi:MAG: acyltransferase [Verrucomicrobiota bacterium]